MARHPDCPFTDARKVIGLDPPKKRTVLPNKFDVPQNLIGVRRQALAALPIGGGCGRRKKRGRPPVQGASRLTSQSLLVVQKVLEVYISFMSW